MIKFSFYINVFAAIVWAVNLVLDLFYFYYTGFAYYSTMACLAAFLVSSHTTVAYLVRKELKK